MDLYLGNCRKAAKAAATKAAACSRTAVGRPRPPPPELWAGSWECVPTEGAGTSAELRRKTGVLGDLSSDFLAPFRADGSSQSCLWQRLVVGRPGGRAGAPGKLGGLPGCRRRGFFEPRVCDSLVYLEIRISPLKELAKKNPLQRSEQLIYWILLLWSNCLLPQEAIMCSTLQIQVKSFINLLMILTCLILTVDFWKSAIKAYTLHVQKHTVSEETPSRDERSAATPPAVIKEKFSLT
nr:uncharacterized protein LOC118972142 [Manis javanica]